MEECTLLPAAGTCWDTCTQGMCRGGELNSLRRPFQGRALPVSYPGTGASKILRARCRGVNVLDARGHFWSQDFGSRNSEIRGKNLEGNPETSDFHVLPSNTYPLPPAL